VKGWQEGYFKLEASINGFNLNPKPYIKGIVKEPTVTQLYFYVIVSENGTHAISSNQIYAITAEANRIYTQEAMSYAVASITPIYDRPEWFNVKDIDMFRDLCSYTNNTGGLEIYCVGSLPEGWSGLHSAARTGYPECGLAIVGHLNINNPSVLAHEIGHACGLEDISVLGLNDAQVSQYLVGDDNWSGGYYPTDLKHADLIRRLLMCQTVNTDNRGDIPLGSLRGFHPMNKNPSGSPPFRRVGHNYVTRNPKH